MSHPHRLHAAAALHSLRAAMRPLAAAADAEARAIAAELLEAADGLCGWRPIVGGSARGGHGDPVGGAVLAADRPPRVNRYAHLDASTTGTLGWLCGRLHVPGAGAPLDVLLAAIPTMHPRLCATLARWLHEADSRVRAALGQQPDLWPLPPTTACPACHVRLLRAQTSPPDTAAWTIVCGAGCLCAGDGCPCGMAVRAAGVAHIWPADSPLAVSALAGVTLTGRTAA